MLEQFDFAQFYVGTEMFYDCGIVMIYIIVGLDFRVVSQERKKGYVMKNFSCFFFPPSLFWAYFFDYVPFLSSSTEILFFFFFFSSIAQLVGQLAVMMMSSIN